MEIENTKTDYYTFFKLYYLSQIKKLNFFLLPILLIVTYNISVNKYELTGFITVFIIIAIIFTALLFFLPFLFTVYRFNKSISRGNSFPYEKRTLLVTPDGIIITVKADTIAYNWQDIVTAKKIGQYIFLVTTDKRSILIPNRSFTFQNDAVSFFKNIENRIENNDNTRPAKLKSIYKKGYLGLIPIIGFFAGVVLIFKGIFQYKDKKLIFIGIAGVLFTVILYSGIIYYTEYSEAGRKNFKIFSQRELNTLFKDIELYKARKNVYPDSLEEIQKYDQFVLIYDPLFYNTFKKSKVKFYYKKMNEKYTLFSIGKDGLPGTPDDIYPEMMDSSANRLGLIKNK